MADEFNALVLRWLKEHKDATATEVVSVSSDSSDWEGDTEGGFYSTFAVEIRYLTPSGKRYAHLQGEAMGSLWGAVVSGYEPPADIGGTDQA